jgi:CheY-like chemotaxis protein
MKTLLVEDDYYFGEEIQQDVNLRFPDCEFQLIRTEKECLELFQSKNPPEYSLIILDVMLPWDDDARAVPDEEAKNEGYFKAGIRCLAAIRSNLAAAKTPVIIHSALDTETIQQAMHQKNIDPSGITIVPKSGDPEPLVNAVARLLQ